MAQSLAQFGQTIKAKHPEYRDMADEDVATKVLAKFPQYRDMVETVAGAGPLGLPQPKNPTVNMQPSSSMVPAALAAGDVGLGALKGAGRTANNIGKLLVPDVALKAAGISTPGRATPPALQPTNTWQKVGGGIEQAGEFFIPGGAEEAAFAKLAPYVGRFAPLLRAGLAAAGSGAVNKAQGGSFTAGAAVGGIGSGVAQGLQKIAPSLAESSIGIRKLDRAYGRTPGRAILDETKGFSPGTVAESAQNTLNGINPQLESLMRTRAVAPVDLDPARKVITDAQDIAISRNAQGSFNQLNPMANHLSANFLTGQRFPQQISPIDALNLKRGFGEEFVHNWNPETMQGTKSIAAKTYRSLADEIHSSVPGSAGLDERASSLIPVAKRAGSTELNAPAGQRILHRFGAHTGALAGGLFGAKQGYDEKGLPGAILGGTLGIAAPELIASPTGQMVAARAFNSPLSAKALRLLGGGVLQLDRPRKDNQEE